METKPPTRVADEPSGWWWRWAALIEPLPGVPEELRRSCRYLTAIAAVAVPITVAVMAVNTGLDRGTPDLLSWAARPLSLACLVSTGLLARAGWLRLGLLAIGVGLFGGVLASAYVRETAHGTAALGFLVLAPILASLSGRVSWSLGGGLLAMVGVLALSVVRPDYAGIPSAFLVGVYLLVSLMSALIARVLRADAAANAQLREQLMVADRLATMGTVAAGIGHELNNPLAYVSANLRFAVDELAAQDVDPEIKNALGDAIEGAERMAGVVQDLRMFSRMDAPAEPLQLERILESSIAISRLQFNRRMEVRRTYSPVPEVLGQHGRLGQVFVNLISNAAHALDDAGVEQPLISVDMRQAGAFVEVVIADNGPGIPEELRTRVFEPFFTTRGARGGTGLGLSLSRNIIQEMEGQLLLGRSEKLGGAEVRVRIPRHGDLSRSQLASAQDQGRRRVLVVDDDPRVARAMERALRIHEVSVVHSAPAARALLEQAQLPDVVLLDVVMPTEDGLALYDWIEAHEPDLATRVVFMTGGVFDRDVLTRLTDTGRPVLEKPVRREELLRYLDGAAGVTPPPA